MWRTRKRDENAGPSGAFSCAESSEGGLTPSDARVTSRRALNRLGDCNLQAPEFWLFSRRGCGNAVHAGRVGDDEFVNAP